MPRSSSQKRLQFSSCDACRRSRVACDAAKQSDPSSSSCSRCLKRKRACTFQWVDNAKRSSRASRERLKPFIAYEPQGKASYRHDKTHISGDSVEPNCPDSIHPEDILTWWCDEIILRGFDTVFGVLLGRYGCPFVKEDKSYPSGKIARLLYEELDTYTREAESSLHDTNKARYQIQKESSIKNALKCAMRAFAAQWIPLTPEAARLPSAKVETTVREAWRKARREMLKVINRTSYRSVLTLYLFAQTPIPFGISEDEELDGLNSLVCMQIALSQLQWLRSRRSAVQFNKAGAPEFTESHGISRKYVDLESRAYWAAMTWDTSTSLLSDCRTSLTSGLKGACSEPTWRLVKAFLVGAFTPKRQKWHEDGFELNNRCVEEIMGAATICNTYIWKNVTSVKEALREGVSGGEVDFAWKALLDAFDIFSASIRPLLIKCDMMSPCLDQRLRLSLYQVQLRHCLGVLVLLEALEAAARSDLLGEVRSLNDNALTTCFDVLKFGLENSYSIESPADESAYILGSRSDITSTLVAINPYPQYVVDMVLIMRKRLARNQNQSESIQDTFPHEMSILSRSLYQLPQSARSVREALAKVSTL